MKNSWRLLIITLFLVLVGCGPRLSLKPEYEKLNVSAVAILPIIDKTELPQDQVSQAMQGFAQAFRNAGFLVLDDSIVQKVCPSSPCTDQKKLFDQYLVNATVQLNIDSKTQANVLAGFYNDISGSLSITDREGVELAHVSATERERGGLLFNTGQILQGLISQVRNEGASALLSSFFRKLVVQLPRPSEQGAQSFDSTTVAIKSVEARATEGDEREICVSATPHSIVSLVLGKVKSNLQEISPGKYCRTYFLNASFSSTNPEIEVRSPFGNSLRSPLVLADNPNCDLSENISLTSANTILFSCPSENQKKPLTYLIYKLEKTDPQPAKIAESMSSRWVDKAGKEDAQYVVIAKSAHGDRSLPIFLNQSSTKQGEK